MMKPLFILLFLFPLDLQAGALETVGTHAKDTVVDAFDSEGLWILGVGSVATVLAHQYDDQVRGNWKDHQKMDPSVTKIGEFWGSGLPEVAILGVQYYYDENNAIPGAEGLIIGNLTVQALKYSVHRERPNGQENVSMPSGHTQASFSLAMSMTQSYGWKKTWPFWAMGVFTGLTRISDDQHWLSDVVAGATIGMLFGRAGFRHHRALQPTVLLHEGHLDGGQITYRFDW